MVVVVIVSLLVVIGLAVLLWRAQAGIEELNRRVDTLSGELDEADNEITAALAEAAKARQERDDAFERVQRARRDASEVAGRLQDERSAREAAGARVASLETELAAHRAEIEERRAAVAELEARLATAPAAGDDGAVEQLWALALSATERTWQTSVATSPDEASPLDGADDPLRTAIEIEVDAAREEAGAAIELVWEVGAAVPTAQAVLALATGRELIASIAKTAAAATLTVADHAGGIDVCVEATDDDGAPLAVAIAGRQAVGPGRYRVGPA